LRVASVMRVVTVQNRTVVCQVCEHAARTLESGARWQDANSYAKDFYAERLAHPFAHTICEIPQAGCPNGSAHADGQAALLDTGTHHGLGEAGGERDPNLLNDY
jgi:hypothetical protein